MPETAQPLSGIQQVIKIPGSRISTSLRPGRRYKQRLTGGLDRADSNTPMLVNSAGTNARGQLKMPAPR
jgi:hypothetical protein